MLDDKQHQEAAEQSDIWDRLSWVWSALYYLTLFLSAYLALSDPDLSASERSWIIGGTIFLAVWQGLLIAYMRTANYRERPLFPIIYLAVLIACWYWLAGIDPPFYFLLFPIFNHIFSLLQMRLAIPVSLMLSVLVAISQLRGQGPITLDNPIIWIYLVLGGFGVVFSLWLQAIIAQSARRRELINELRRTQATLAESERNAGILAERQRLAREIHDTLAQGFTSIIMHLEAAEQALPDDLDTVHRYLDQSRRIARDSLDQARQVVNDLRPDLLQREPLPSAIERVVRRWSEESGIAAEAVTTGTVYSLHPQVEVTLLRATQEALANVRKHAQASKAAVTLSYMDDVVMLDVQDDGVGLKKRLEIERLETEPNLQSPISNLLISQSPNLSSPGGFGLRAMGERVAMLNGTILLESTPNEGTTLVVEIPTGQLEGGE